MEQPKILIAEDERIIALDLKATIHQLGYLVIGIARSGKEVIEKARENKPHLVLMDIILEGEMNGIDAAKIICDETKIPIIFITASTDPLTLKLAQDTNPVGILNKPFSSATLNVAIERALQN